MVVTRFAPSPTGFLHIGGARTALFSWLYARANGGKYLLRVEDTDLERSTQAAVDAILDGLNWLGLTPDEPPVFQSIQADRHRQVAEELVTRGAAYHCPVTPAELQARRDEAEALRTKKAADGGLSDEDAQRLDELLKPYRSPWRDGRPLPDGAATVVRLRMPDEGSLTVNDRVQGPVTLRYAELDDLILLRSDGTPTYMLAVVVDDHDMGVTHVIRGDDHLTNTFRQTPIFQAMGWDAPVYAHVPMIHGPDGKKLSKRHGALGVDAYRDMGYLPEALCNYLLRLGWSHGDDEIISQEQAIEWFNLEALNKAPARLDFDKLNAVNAHYMAQADSDRLSDLYFAREEAQGLSETERSRIRAAMDVLKTRAGTVAALHDASRFLHEIRPIRLEGKAAKLLSEEGKQRVRDLVSRFGEVTDWSDAILKQVLTRYCEEMGIGIGKVGPLLRAALTGGAPAPDISIVLELLGREESLSRLSDQLN
ncbi:MAG: glutamate--tRNA ligase [Hyphomonadaceae bacterium]